MEKFKQNIKFGFFAVNSEVQSSMKERLQLNFPRKEFLEKSREDKSDNGDCEVKLEKGNVNQRIDELCQRIEEKEETVKKKREELHKYVIYCN